MTYGLGALRADRKSLTISDLRIQNTQFFERTVPTLGKLLKKIFKIKTKKVTF